MSRLSGKKYIVARKGVKVYMDNPIEYKETSITTQKEQSLFLGHEDGDLLTGKKYLLLMMLSQQERVLRLFRAL